MCIRAVRSCARLFGQRNSQYADEFVLTFRFSFFFARRKLFFVGLTFESTAAAMLQYNVMRL